MGAYPTTFDKDALLACARGELFGPGNAQLPAPPMLMMDRITEISEDGGDNDATHGISFPGSMTAKVSWSTGQLSYR